MRKIIILLLLICLPPFIFGMGDPEEQLQEITYDIYELTAFQDNWIITGITSSGRLKEKIDIPKMVNGKPVIAIGDEAFIDCYNTADITIPDGVVYIGEKAFSGCEKLTSIIIPNSVEEIGSGAFEDCSNLQKVILPNELETIDETTFYGCRKLANIIIPNSVTEIGENAFTMCLSLNTINIPENVKSIEDSAFAFCINLKNITVDKNNQSYSAKNGVLFSKDKSQLIAYPGGKKGAVVISKEITTIKDSALLGCLRISKVKVEKSNTHYCSRDGILYTKDMSRLIFCPSEIKGEKGIITIPEGVISISDGAFFWCDKITKITIPESVTSIGYAAFDCGNLLEIDVNNYNRFYCSDDGVLFNKDKTEIIRCPEGKTGTITIPESITKIEKGAFKDCDGISNITLLTKLPPEVGKNAFTHYDRWTSIKVPYTAVQAYKNDPGWKAYSKLIIGY